VVRAGLRRILVVVAVVLGGTAALSAALGALAGKSILHALAVGFYVVAAALLLGSLALGGRGPTRVDRSAEDYGGRHSLGRRERRKATPEERREARWTSLGLFAFGLLLVLLGAALDPSRRVF
jgi:hypothetical protein